jgi:hypothetical protein
MLPDGWKERLQLHRQANVPADLESARHGDGCSTQLALQNLDAILSRHREHYVGIGMHPLCDLTGPLPDRENVLPALRAAQIELVDRIKIFGGICIELTWEKLKKLFDGSGLHGSYEGEGTSRIDPGSRGAAAPGPLLVAERDRRGTATRAEKVFGERLDDGRVIALAAENVEVGVVRVVRKMAADQRGRDQLHHGIAGDAA